MPPGQWNTGDRKERLPSHWAFLRVRVLRRDYRTCQAIRDEHKCGRKATDVDHIVAGDDHSLENLQALCKDCHAKKSSAEGLAKRRQMNASKRRKKEEHPSMRRSE